jgi:hypothetical protein
MSISDPFVQQQKSQLRQDLHETLQIPRACHGRPTQRLAAMVAAELIGQERHTPWSLAVTIQRIDELRGRLTAAKV